MELESLLEALPLTTNDLLENLDIIMHKYNVIRSRVEGDANPIDLNSEQWRERTRRGSRQKSITYDQTVFSEKNEEWTVQTWAEKRYVAR